MDTSLSLTRSGISRWRFTFLIKLLGLAALVALADRLFYRAEDAGATLGVFAFALLLTIVALRPEIRRSPPALLAAAAGAWCAFWLFDDPGLLGLGLSWIAISMAVLLPRSANFGSGLRWAQRLALHSAATPVRPIQDFGRIAAARRRRPSRITMPALLATLLLPIVGTALFLALFAQANPLIGDALGGLHPLGLFSGFSPGRIVLWLFVAALSWRLLSPRLLVRDGVQESDGLAADLPGFNIASVTISLVAFNALFALQNGLDLAFLWSGAPLPDGMSLAEYAHRGAYPLIGTALLAGLFVLATTRAGSDMADNRLIRRLVYAWTAQNVFLVASTMLRTIDYIDAYLLTDLRIEALIWMALVALGLILICLRLALGKSSNWLVNANLLAASLILLASTAIDYDRTAAGWNVRHAREVGGRGAAIDLCYLNSMGDSALLPLIELEGRQLQPALRERVSWVRNLAMDRLEARQQRWDSWDWRGSRRLDAARELVARHKLPRFRAGPRECDGSALIRPEVAPPTPAFTPPQPLTAAKGR